MPDPKISDRKPIAVQLEPGEHHWCSCGESAGQPFCDGSHRNTTFRPLAFSVDSQQDAHLCMCKFTKNPPYCDGSHAQLPAAESTAAPAPAAASSGLSVVANTPEEPTLAFVKALARDGLEKLGHHGEMGAMGVPRLTLPQWDDIQILVAQLARKPLLDDAAVNTELVIGPRAKRPLRLKIPIFVSDMSFGALSEEAKTALAKGAEGAGTGICSGEGGMLPEEQQANSRYFYEYASAKFGYREELLTKVQAFHFKGGQGAKTGTGGHLPGSKVKGKIAKVRCLPEGQPAISPATFVDLHTPADFKRFADRVREVTGGIPIGM